MTLVAMVVLTVLGIALIDGSTGTLMQGHRQSRLASLQALADAGAQYGYWQYTYGNVPADGTIQTAQSFGPGSFTITITNFDGTVGKTIRVTSTAKIADDSLTVRRVYNVQPSSPINLTATVVNSTVSLSWSAVTNATSYNVYRGTSSGGESSLTTGLTTTSYNDAGVTNGVTYYYTVTAVQLGTVSQASNEASATPGAAQSLRVTFSSPVSSVNLTTQGTLDWSEWGYDFHDHKSGGGSLISDITYLNSSAQTYVSTPKYSWTDGSPTAVATNTTATYYVNSTGSSETFTIPTYTTSHTARVYVAEDSCTADFNVTMSGTSLSYDDTSNMATTTGHGGHKDGIYTIVYTGNAGGSLTITYSVKKHHGQPSASQISVQAVTLQ